MQIRKIEKNELNDLGILFEHGNFERYKWELYQDIINGVRDIYVVVEDRKLIGEITVHYKTINNIEAIENKRVYLSAYRILKSKQGLGLGQKLLEYVLKDLIKKGYNEFTIGVEEENLKAKYIYEKFGFNKVIAKLDGTYKEASYEYDLLLKVNKI